MMQRRKHMMSREKFISVLFRQQQSGLFPLLIFVRMKVIAVVDSIFGKQTRYNGAGVIGRSFPLRG